MVDESFKCDNCDIKVKALSYTARNHCPKCLYSKHLDLNPGDRKANCGGLMEPISIEKNKKGKYQIIHRCLKCGIIKKNIIANDDDNDLILTLLNPLNISNYNNKSNKKSKKERRIR